MVLVALLAGLAIGGAATLVWMEADSDDAAVDAGGGTGTDPAGGETPPESTAPAASDTTAAPDPDPVTLAFVGDINVEFSLADRLAAAPDDFVGPFADVLRDADLAIANLEAAVTSAETPLDKEFTFRAPPEVLDALAAGGIDVVTSANDHAIDHGPEGLAETLAIKAARDDGMLVGIGNDEDEAYAPHVAEVGGQRIAVFSATQVIEPSLIESWTATADQAGVASAKRVDRLVEAVADVRDDVDTVVVYVHWGTETEECPNSSQQELARALEDAGADIVVGTHAHRLQGAGRLGDGFVAYGLGNFLFGALSDAGARSGVLLVEVDGSEVLGFEWVPGRIDDRVAMPLAGDEASAAVSSFEQLRDCTELTG